MIHLNANHFIYLILAAQWTILLSLIAFVGGALVGLPIALMRVSRLKAVRTAASLYIQLMQGTPLLIVLFLSYFGLGILGFKLVPIVAAGLALTVYAAAFLGEIWRGCIEAVPKTQWEASDCLGLDAAAPDLAQERRSVEGERQAGGDDRHQLVTQDAEAEVREEQDDQQRRALDQLDVAAGERPQQADLRDAQQRDGETDDRAADEGDQRQQHGPARGEQQIARDIPQGEFGHVSAPL